MADRRTLRFMGEQRAELEFHWDHAPRPDVYKRGAAWRAPTLSILDPTEQKAVKAAVVERLLQRPVDGARGVAAVTPAVRLRVGGAWASSEPPLATGRD